MKRLEIINAEMRYTVGGDDGYLSSPGAVYQSHSLREQVTRRGRGSWIFAFPIDSLEDYGRILFDKDVEQ